MHNSTLIVLVILTIGQMLMMAFGAFILWIMGDLGDAPQQLRRDESLRQGGKNLVPVPQEAVKLVEENAQDSINCGEEGSIAPQAAEHQGADEAAHPPRARGKAA